MATFRLEIINNTATRGEPIQGLAAECLPSFSVASLETKRIPSLPGCFGQIFKLDDDERQLNATSGQRLMSQPNASATWQMIPLTERRRRLAIHPRDQASASGRRALRKLGPAAA